jgi:hypothetical protein
MALLLPILVAGDTPLDTWTLIYANNTPADLSGLITNGLILFMHEENEENPFQGRGTFLVQNASIGLITYQWDAQDTANPGTYHLAVQATFSTGQIATFGILNLVTQIIQGI